MVVVLQEVFEKLHDMAFYFGNRIVQHKVWGHWVHWPWISRVWVCTLGAEQWTQWPWSLCCT